MKSLLTSLLSAITLFSTGQSTNEHFLFVGTYTGSGSEGIYVYKFNDITGDFSEVSNVKTTNPSYLAVSPDEKYVFAVNEDKPDGVSSFSFDKTSGSLKAINKQSSNGDHPCYVSITKSGKWVVAGNYTGGNFSVLPVHSDGSLGPATDIVNHTGSSVNTERQEKAHVHSTVFSNDNKYLFVSDLGMDKIMIYSFDSNTGKTKPTLQPFMIVEPGAGPRHFVFHPSGKYAYLIEELSGTISGYKYSKKGRLELLQNISALPPDYTGPVGSADIHVSPDGRFVYGSNRGESNTIAIFSVDQNTGMLTLVGHQSTMGETPRNFNFDPSGNFLLVANQNSDDIVIFKRDKQTGLLTDTGKRIKVSKPVCLKWASVK